MGIIERAIFKLLSAVLRYRDIYKEVDGQQRLYLRRFFLWLREKGSTTGDEGGRFLHVIFLPDLDRDPHDHPWDFKSLILRRGYLDEQWVKCFGKVFCRIQKVGFLKLVSRRAEHLHRVRGIEEGKPAWTLVSTGPQRREWGFVDDKGWVHWKKYLGL